jgi:hypothetical protein
MDAIQNYIGSIGHRSKQLKIILFPFTDSTDYLHNQLGFPILINGKPGPD